MTLHRAIVTMPASMGTGKTSSAERVVFFEASQHAAYLRLTQLADAVWRIATSSWGDLCFVQELMSEHALTSASTGKDTGDLRLLELGCNTFDSRGPRYATSAETVLWVEPRTHERLLTALAIAPLRKPGVTA